MRGAGGGANLLALRSHNTALVLDLLRTAGAEGISRLELAERTGLTPQAVSKITARLREEGLAAEAGRRASTGGKPRTVLRLVPEAGHAVGVHLDRDELRAVLADLDGTVVARRHAPLDLGAGSEAVLGRVASAVGELGAVAGVRSLLGVGVALPGPLDHRRGVLHRVTGFPEWDGFPLRDALTARLGGVPVVVDKDTNAVALGLAVEGEGGSFAYLHLGTGLGAGLVIGGSVHRGPRTGAGSSGIRWCSWTGRCAGAGTGGAWRRCAWRPWTGGMWGRRLGYWGPGRRTWWGCWTSTGCWWVGARWRGRRGCFSRAYGGCLRRGRGGRGRSVWGWGWCRGRSGLRKARRSWCWHRCSGRTVSCAGVG